ncbi:LppU/SCO3897 family protein [Nocardia sp. IBHARD005]|uniref:LppU/SCO3897 family protein n=1 Tax=Nocardia sp. IBHARD005 TaxID=3457765 RepID=UPI00405881B2
MAGVSVVAVFALAGSFYVALTVVTGFGARVPGLPENDSAAKNSPSEVSATQPLGTIVELSGGVASTLSKSVTRIPRVNLSVGDCVDLGVSSADIRQAACGSTNSHYKVTELASASGRCPGDVDRAQPRALPGGVDETVCLDIDWTVGGCIDLSGGAVRHVECTADVPGRLRVLEIRHDTTDVNVCTAGDRGVVYDERRYVVCVSSR